MAGEAAQPVSTPANAATAAEAKMSVERAKQEIAQEEKTWSEEVAREKDAETRRRQRYSEFSQDRVRLQQTLAEQEAGLKATLAKMETHQYRERELQARFTRLSQVLSARAIELRAALASGIPYRLDKRLESIDLLIRDLAGGNISPEEAMNRLWSFEQAERRLAQEAEVYSGDFSGDAGDPIQVQYLRIGKQLLAFSSLDGSKLGVMRQAAIDDAGSRDPVAGASKPAYEWVRESEMDREMRHAIKNAIATAQGKSIPGFVPLPVWKQAFRDKAVGTESASKPGPSLPDPSPRAQADTRTSSKGPAK